ncbi:hypothetical protein SDC9_199698 [bioreactor metagenome]|uniref:Uncharacterized protein n=1 Tax=bioreactor metagenome TaxID=1076179 RepID=A0A645ILY3_9ZZZZ
MVRGLVEQQQVGLLQQELAQRHPATLATGEDVHDGVSGWALQGVHGLFQLRIEIPGFAVVEFGLQFAHLGQQGVEVGVRFPHGC